LYSRRKKGVVEEIFERIQKFKKFKESLEPYISRRKCRKCGGELVVNWDVTWEVIKMENEDME
jgi:excinuclease UvrABC ATPase subunit